MKFPRFIQSMLIGLVLLITACTSTSQNYPAIAHSVPTRSAQSATVTSTPPASSSEATTVNLGKNDKLGSFLVDAKGMTLYLLTKDSPNTSSCYDKCATNWPPLLSTGTPIAGDGVDAAKFGTTTRTDGSVQVTYNGWPLYHYKGDSAPGDTAGEGVGSVWFAVSPAGDKVTVSTNTNPYSY